MSSRTLSDGRREMFAVAGAFCSSAARSSAPSPANGVAAGGFELEPDSSGPGCCCCCCSTGRRGKAAGRPEDLAIGAISSEERAIIGTGWKFAGELAVAAAATAGLAGICRPRCGCGCAYCTSNGRAAADRMSSRVLAASSSNLGIKNRVPESTTRVNESFFSYNRITIFTVIIFSIYFHFIKTK